MTAILIANIGEGRSTAVEVGERIGGGAVGDVYRLEGRPGWVAKLYRTPGDRDAYEHKIADMIREPPDLPPLQENGHEYVQIAWPLAELREHDGTFVGFVMPEIDMSAATELENVLQKASRRARGLPELYGGRVLLAANLAALMAELHRHGHYFIDMKPINIRFYPGAWYLAILDTDGFSVHGTARWPARQFSDEYIAPEARNQPPEVLGVEQDLFALAVIIFRLLNNGLHPYQGLDVRPGLPTTLQERIFDGLYAYGRTPSGAVRPAPATIHESFEDSTRELFDRAFGGDPAARPTADEWKAHLQGLITAGILRKCSRRPEEHMHFSRPCGLCALEARRAAAPPPAPRPTPAPNVQRGRAAVGAAARGRRPSAPQRMARPPSPHGATLGRVFAGSVASTPPPAPPPPPPESNAQSWIIVGVLACLVLGAAIFGPQLSQEVAAPAAPAPPSYTAPTASSPPRSAQQVAVARMDDEALCRSALSTNATNASLSEVTWETSPPYAAQVAEAHRRGFTVATCFAILRRRSEAAPAAPPPSVTPPSVTPPSATPPAAATVEPVSLAQLSLAEVCRTALAASVTTTSKPAQAAWDDRAVFESYVQEARRRGQTPQSCAMALR